MAHERDTSNDISGGSASARVRKASVRAKLFQKPEMIRIGRFILLETLGAGAMGEVHAAYDEQLDRKVALKLVRPGLGANTRADERLLREAQTLAQVSHPNVVQVYDAGLHEGSVFLAMEFVRGQTLTGWLEGVGELPRRQRQREIVQRFIAAGRGLEAAHAVGLAHRDFKPDNVLVGDDGRVRVADFGLARAVDDSEDELTSTRDEVKGDASASVDERVEPLAETRPLQPSEADPVLITNEVTLDLDSHELMPGTGENSEHSSGGVSASFSGRKAALRLTATGTVMGTPRYMAPEQMTGQTPDHRSDQFSFCVALFHALYGEWPFRGKTFLELSRAVTSGEVELPKSSADVPAPVRRAILRGLARDPDERFPNMGALLRELEAWPQRGRRRLAIAAAAVVVVAGVAGAVGLSRGAAPCEAVSVEFDGLWSPARKAALERVFVGSELPYAATVWRNTAALLDDYAARWRREARDACEATRVYETQSEAQLDERMNCLRGGVRRLDALLTGLDSGADEVVERAVDLASVLPDPAVCSDPDAFAGPQPPAQAWVRDSVERIRVRLAEARTQELLGDYDGALGIAEGQVQEAQSLAYQPVVAEALHQRGRVLTARGEPGDHERAEDDFAEVERLLEQERYPSLAVELWHDRAFLASRAHSDMSRGYVWAGREQAAVLASGNPLVARAEALHGLGRLFFRDGKYDQAAEMQRRAIALLEEDEGRSPLKLAAYHKVLANALADGGDPEGSAVHFERAQELLIEQLGEEHPQTVSLSYDYGRFLNNAAKFEQARELLTRVLESRTSGQPDESAKVGRVHLLLAELYTYTGAFDEARFHAREARVNFERAYPEGHRYRSNLDATDGFLALREGRFAAAREAYQRALRIRLRHLNEAHPFVGWARAYQAEADLGLGEYAAAEAAAAETLRFFTEAGTAPADLRIYLLSICGRALLGRGKAADAIAPLEQAAGLHREHGGDALIAGVALWALARALYAGGDEEVTHVRALAEKARALFAPYGDGAASEREAVERWLDRLSEE
ncbi:protein kinase domain-containing protein [Haliangium sp.]|uniref:protein kinase domain-containing protein n=1 Tax=Haliangium sp. TaxID=2663208 RepID=UPI003D0EADCA